MDDHSKTIMCSILFLEIAGYARTPVYAQLTAKRALDACIAAALGEVPAEDRMLLDTGDGAAIGFLGDVGDALRVAFRLRDAFGAGQPGEAPRSLRAGINLGPVRQVRNMHGQPAMVGDGINVAQRIMGFAAPCEILASRSYCEAVSRLSAEHAALFRHLGSRTDQYVREHEVYAIDEHGQPAPETAWPASSPLAAGADTLAAHLGDSWGAALALFRKASPPMRAAYALVVITPFAALVGLPIALTLTLARPTPSPWRLMPAPPPALTAAALPAPAVAVSSVPSYVALPVPAAASPRRRTVASAAEHDPRARITVACTAGTSVFVDGRPTGRIMELPVVIHVDAGRHTVVLVHPAKSQVHAEDVELAAGKSLRLANGPFCS